MKTFRLISNTMVFDLIDEYTILNGSVPCVYGTTGNRYKKQFATHARKEDVVNLDPWEEKIAKCERDPLHLL